MAEKQSDSKATELPVCGIIMPISGIPETVYTEEHWGKVKDLIERAAKNAGFRPQMVYESESTSIIQKNIITSIYYNEIIVCDVSGRNPNVMFELGIRLCVNKPVVIIKDTDTSYPFDIATIKYIEYPTCLEFHKTLSFINTLSKHIKSTYDTYKNDPEKVNLLGYSANIESGHIETKYITPKEIVDIVKDSLANLNEKSDLDEYIHELKDLFTKKNKTITAHKLITWNRHLERKKGS